MIELDWESVYQPDRGTKTMKKFAQLSASIPWGMDFEENVWTTLEWLVRDGRKEEIRYNPDPLLNPVRDGWYNSEFDEGRFFHVCYPQDMLKFRGQYDSLRMQLMDSPDDLRKGKELLKDCKARLWSAWNCVGADGDRVEPEAPVDELYVATPYFEWPREWTNQCSRCCAPLPKALRMWVKLQHSKLKDAN